MADHVFYGYAPGAIEIDPETGAIRLASDYSRSTDRARFEISDDDSFAHGDSNADEVGDDSNQTGTVYAADGSVLGSGKIYVEDVLWFTDASGEVFSVTVFESNGVVVGYVPSQPMQPGESYSYAGTTEAGQKPGGKQNNDANNNYTEYEKNSVPCFGPGTMIMTQDGEIPVEWLETSDRLLTRDHGYQPILWIGRTRLAPGHFSRCPADTPVRIPAGSMSPDRPSHDLEVTGDHRILIRDGAAELMFASSEVLAPAKAWVDAKLATAVARDGSYTLTHILCAAHEVIMAQGLWVESMFPGPETLRRLSPMDRATVSARLGPDRDTGLTARPCLTRREAVLLLSDIYRDAGRQALARTA